jgi:glycosyltransferase involved in cell wall biosynthesis
MSDTLNIADRVHFPGYMGLQDGLPQVYRLASLFVTASEIEVQSLVLLEAIASALPIVAVRATFVPEVVQDGINGFLAEPGDIHGLASAISTILNNPEQRQKMSKSSRVLAEMHDINVSIDLHEQFYDCFVKQPKMEPVLEKTDRQSRWRRLKGWIEISQQ